MGRGGRRSSADVAIVDRIALLVQGLGMYLGCGQATETEVVDRDLDWDLAQYLAFFAPTLVLVRLLVGVRDNVEAEIDMEGLAEDAFELGLCHFESWQGVRHGLRIRCCCGCDEEFWVGGVSLEGSACGNE